MTNRLQRILPVSMALACLSAAARSQAPLAKAQAEVDAQIDDTRIAAILSELPVVETGGAKHEIDSRNPFLAARLQSDGGLVVSERNSLKLVSPDGSKVRTVGRRGRGPGEFHHVFDICVFTADSILVIEYGIHLVHVFDASGAYVRTLSPPGWVGRDACFSDGTFLARGTPRPSAGEPRLSNTQKGAMKSPLFLVNKSATKRVGSAPLEDYSHGYPLPANVAAAGHTFVIGQGNAPSYQVYSREGRLLQTVRWNESAKGRSHGNGETPSFSLLKADTLGHVWVQRVTANGKSWGAFDRSGSWLGRLAVPARLSGRTIMPLDTRSALVSWQDEDGFAHIAVHRIVWRAP